MTFDEEALFFCRALFRVFFAVFAVKLASKFDSVLVHSITFYMPFFGVFSAAKSCFWGAFSPKLFQFLLIGVQFLYAICAFFA